MGMLNHHVHGIIKRRLITNAGRVSTFYAGITFILRYTYDVLTTHQHSRSMENDKQIFNCTVII